MRRQFADPEDAPFKPSHLLKRAENFDQPSLAGSAQNDILKQMLTGPLVSVQEYLSTSYRPDCDYIDGVVVERNLGQFDHSTIQGRLIVMLSQHAKQWGVLVRPELRLKIRERKYRVPDVMVLSVDAPRTPVIETAPLLCLEIVSSDDRLRELTERASDYLALGVPETWIFDPAERRAYVYSANGLHEAPRGALLSNGSVSLDTAALWAED